MATNSAQPKLNVKALRRRLNQTTAQAVDSLTAIAQWIDATSTHQN